MKKLLLILLFVLVFPLGAKAHVSVSGDEDYVPPHGEEKATIYFNEQCHGCSDYLFNKLAPYLEKRGYEIRWQDYIEDPAIRTIMRFKAEQIKLPLYLQSHIMVYLEPTGTILGGHLPLSLVDEVMDRDESIYPSPLVIIQDEMVNFEKDDLSKFNYQVYSPNYGVQEFRLDQSLEEYLSWYQNNEGKEIKLTDKSMWLLVLSSGFIDGLNPCAFGVLFLFISLLLALRRTRKKIIITAGTYIVGIYVAYLLIGFGLVGAISIIPSHHFAAKLSALIMAVLGIGGLLSYFGVINLKYHLPMVSKDWIGKYMNKGTVIAALVAGFLVGLCTFPCSGGIYVGIVTMLSASTTFWPGFWFMILYNVMFILPLVIILILGTNVIIVEKMQKLKNVYGSKFGLLNALLMIALSLLLFLWFS